MMTFATAVLIWIVLFCIIQSCLLCYSIKSKTIYIFGSSFLIILAGIILYNTYCIRYVDLDRMAVESNVARSSGISYLISEYSLNPLSGVLIYFATLIDNINILKLISAVVYFGCIFYLLRLFSLEKRHISAILLSGLYLFSTLDLSSLADGIRFPIASILFCTGALDLLFFGNQKVRSHFILIVSCLIHVSMWPFYILVLISNFKRLIFKSACVVCLMIYIVLFNFSDSIARIFPKFEFKFEMYFNQQSQYYADLNSAEQILFYFISLSVALFIFLKSNKTNKRFSRFYILSVLFVVGMLPSNVAFSRYVPVILILSIVYIIEYIEKYTLDYNLPKTIRISVIYLFILYCCLNFTLRFFYSYTPFFVVV